MIFHKSETTKIPQNSKVLHDCGNTYLINLTIAP